MKKIIELFSKKSVVSAIVLGILGVLRAMGIPIPAGVEEVVISMMAIAFRHAILKAEKAPGEALEEEKKNKTVRTPIDHR
jgi:hypothetical protein